MGSSCGRAVTDCGVCSGACELRGARLRQRPRCTGELRVTGPESAAGCTGEPRGARPEARVVSTFPAQLASGLALQELVPERVDAARVLAGRRRRLAVGRQLHLGEPQAGLLQRQRGCPRRGARGPETHGSARLPAPQLGPRPGEQQLGPRAGHRGRHHHAEAEQHGEGPIAAGPGRLGERRREPRGRADTCGAARLWSGHAAAAVGSRCTRELSHGKRAFGAGERPGPTVGLQERKGALDIVRSPSRRLESTFTKSRRRK